MFVFKVLFFPLVMFFMYVLQPIHLYNRHFTSLASNKLTKGANIRTNPPQQHMKSIPEEVYKYIAFLQ